MKTHRTCTIIALVLMSFLAIAKAETANLCQQETINILRKSLSRCWAKEYSGLDLTKKLIRQDRKIFPETFFANKGQKTKVAVFDLGFEKDHVVLTHQAGEEPIEVPPQLNGRRTMRAHHGTSVVNLLTGPEEIRMTDEVSLIGLGAITHSFHYPYYYSRFEKSGVFPRIISNSLGWKSEKTPTLAEKAHQRNILWFLAAGNSFPKPVNPLEINSKALLVGSFAPNGLTSYEAQIHKDMLILAPANKELLTINGYGELHYFGASSGATPIITATLTQVAFYLPNINRDQTTKLLRKTAWRSFENKWGLNNHPPLLNAYKATRLARSIYLTCSGKKNCIDSIFDGLDETIIEKLINENQVEIKLTLEQSLREKTLLGDSRSRIALTQLYSQQGLYWNKEYFEFIASDTINLNQMEEWTKQAATEGLFEFNSYRYLPLYSQETRDFIQNSPTIKEHHKKNYLGLTLGNLSGN